MCVRALFDIHALELRKVADARRPCANEATSLTKEEEYQAQQEDDL